MLFSWILIPWVEPRLFCSGSEFEIQYEFCVWNFENVIWFDVFSNNKRFKLLRFGKIPFISMMNISRGRQPLFSTSSVHLLPPPPIIAPGSSSSCLHREAGVTGHVSGSLPYLANLVTRCRCSQVAPVSHVTPYQI